MLYSKCVDGELQIINSDWENQIPVALVPLTGDEEFDKASTEPLCKLFCAAPKMAKTLNAIANDCDSILFGQVDDVIEFVQGLHLAACQFSQFFEKETEDQRADAG